MGNLKKMKGGESLEMDGIGVEMLKYGSQI